jgi:hypothetical protein
MSTTFTDRLLGGLLALAVAGCAHRTSVAPLQPSHVELASECTAEIVAVKREPWEFRLSAHGYPDAIWQGPVTVSFRFLSPAAHAGEIRSMGVYHEREITFDERLLAPGDTIRFHAADSVLQQSTVPDVFSSLSDVTLETKKTEANQSPEPTR